MQMERKFTALEIIENKYFDRLSREDILKILYEEERKMKECRNKKTGKTNQTGVLSWRTEDDDLFDLHTFNCNH